MKSSRSDGREGDEAYANAKKPARVPAKVFVRVFT
jgi:hypothetical protein